jgi:hypothetical protein
MKNDKQQHAMKGSKESEWKGERGGSNIQLTWHSQPHSLTVLADVPELSHLSRTLSDSALNSKGSTEKTNDIPENTQATLSDDYLGVTSPPP